MGRNSLLAAGSSVCAPLALALGIVSVSSPYWGTFHNSEYREHGHFGPWTVCRQRGDDYRCGPYASLFRTTEYSLAAGICSLMSVILSAILCVTSPAVLAMQLTRRQIFIKFRLAVIIKLILSCVTVSCCFMSIILFLIDIDARQIGVRAGFITNISWAFYILLFFTLVSLVLCGFASAEFVLARRWGGNPVKMSRDPDGYLAHVMANPNARHLASMMPLSSRSSQLKHEPQIVPMAQVPQPNKSNGHLNLNGDTRSKSHVLSTSRDFQPPQALGHDMPRPLRSSLKKKRSQSLDTQEDIIDSALIIENSNADPSYKRVRIQSLDTEV